MQVNGIGRADSIFNEGAVDKDSRTRPKAVVTRLAEFLRIRFKNVARGVSRGLHRRGFGEVLD
jgi:hypothetical protein